MANIYPVNEKLFKEKEEELYSKLSELLDESYYVYYEPIQFMKKGLVLIIRENFGIFILRIEDRIDFSDYYQKLSELYFPEDKEKLGKLLGKQLSFDKDYFYSDICPEAGIIINKNEKAFSSVKIGYWLKHQDDLPELPFLNLWGSDSTVDKIIEEIKKDLRPYVIEGKKEITMLAKKVFFSNSWEPLLKNKKNAGIQISPNNSTPKIELQEEQESDIYYNGPKNRRVAGSAGTGKTTIGVKRAIERAKAGDRVLYLHYNITLKKYIENRIRSCIPQNYDKESILSRIKVLHFHMLLQMTGYKGNLEEQNNKYYNPYSYSDDADEHNEKEESKMFKESYNSLDLSFNTVIVDESQDFKDSYFDILRELFPTAQFLFLGDFNQNIYQRKWKDLEDEGQDKKKKTLKPALKGFGFSGQWRTLKQNYRPISNFNKKIVDFCNFFGIVGPQENSIKEDNLVFDFGDSEIIYYDTKLNLNTKLDSPTVKLGKYVQDKIIDEKTIKCVCRFINQVMGEKGFKAKDTVILSQQKDTIRTLQKFYSNYETMVDPEAFLTKEKLSEYERKFRTTIQDKDSFDRIVSSCDRLYKIKFDNNKNVIKFSTIYSYKGYEANNVIILLDTLPGEKENNKVQNNGISQNMYNKTQVYPTYGNVRNNGAEQNKKPSDEELALIYTAISRSRGNVVLIAFNDICDNEIKKYFKSRYDYVKENGENNDNLVIPF